MSRYYDIEKTKQEVAKGKTQGDLKFWNVPEGETIIRLLPPPVEFPDRLPFYRHYNHYLQDLGVVRCRKTLGIDESCPICEWVARMRDNPEMKDMVVKLASSIRYATNIIVRGEEPPTVRIWSFGLKMARDLSNYLTDEDYLIREGKEESDILDPVKGRDFKITRLGTGLATQYQISPRPNISPISTDPEVMERILEQRYNLPLVLKVLEPEELASQFFTWLQSHGFEDDSGESIEI